MRPTGLLGAADVLRFLESGKRLPTPFPRDCTHGTFLFSRIMMCCWHSDAELRPSFASIVSTLKGHLQASKEAAEERHNRRESRVRSRTIRKVLAVKRYWHDGGMYTYIPLLKVFAVTKY